MEYYLLQRLCWNTNGYQYPSGDKIEIASGFAGEHGFGYEEWNFNKNDIIDGFCYGYMYQTPKLALDGKKYNIIFYTKNSDKEDILIGMYRNAEFLNVDKRKNLEDTFKKTEIYSRRKEELKSLCYENLSDDKKITNYILGQTDEEKYLIPLNLKVKPKDIILLGFPIPIKNIFVDRLNYHYTTAENISKNDNKRLPLLKIFDDQTHAVEESIENKILNEESYLRKSCKLEKSIIPLHNKLSNSFRTYLEETHFINIKCEKNCIDVLAEKNDKSYMFELKVITTPYVRHGIREALGQILEYNFYPNRKPFDYFAIVISRAPTQQEILWCKNINKKVFKFELYWFDEGKFHKGIYKKSH